MTTMLDTLKRRLVDEEGWRNHVYTDTLGHPTIGVGFNLDRDDAHVCLANVNANYEHVRNGTSDLSNDQVSELLDNCIAVCETELLHVHPSYDTYPEPVQIVLLDMLFNMGLGVFVTFKHMHEAVRASDWVRAAREMLASTWAVQVPTRAHALAELMESAKES